MLIEKFTVARVYFKNEVRYQISNLTLNLKEIEKGVHAKPNTRKRQEIIKIREKWNEK